MKPLSRFAFVVISVALTVISSHSFAKHRGEGFRPMHKLFQEVSVSDEQRADIRQLAKQLRQDMRVFRADGKEFRQALNQLTVTDDFNQESVTLLLTENQATKQQIDLLQARFKHAVWEILDDEQQSAAQTFLADRAPREPNPRRQLRFFEKLDFSDEQIAQAEVILDQSKEQLETLKGDIEGFKAAERALVTSDNFSDEAWTALYQENADTFVQVHLVRITTMNQIRDLMTEEQREQAKEFKPHRGHKGKHHKTEQS
jgi:Spy/CpxP family protein refolding chaperone